MNEEFDCPHVNGGALEYGLINLRTIPWSDRPPPRTEAETHLLCEECFKKLKELLHVGFAMAARKKPP